MPYLKEVSMKWKSYLPIGGSAAAIIALIIFMAGACARIYYKDMVHVEGGQFDMGCAECQQHERPVHNVKLGGYWIDRYEVTNSLYVDFLNTGMKKGYVNVVQIETGGSSYQQVEINGNRAIYLYPSVSWSQIIFEDSVFSVIEGKEEFPVNVSWRGANAYCEALGKRLPTEAEWEYAAKGGNMHLTGAGSVGYFRYSGSNNPDSVAWHLYNSGSSSHKVGTLKANELSVYDMSGNLREWVSDWYDPNYYSNSPGINPQGPDEPVYIQETGTTAGKVMRGGSWREDTQQYYEDQSIETSIDRQHVRVTKRDYGCPCNLSTRTGFRCVAPEFKLPVFFQLTFTRKKPKSTSSFRWSEEEKGPIEQHE